MEKHMMTSIAAAAYAVAFAVLALALACAPASALMTQPVSSALPRIVTKVENPRRCTQWVSYCIHRFGDRSPKYGQCLRNHGC
jgi:hypothetical protein